MKTICSYLLCPILVFSSLSAEEVWITHWANAIELSRTANNPALAIAEYSHAISAIDPKEIGQHLYLLNERGNVYLKAQDYNRAIKDFSFVIGNKEASKQEFANALWGRIQAYLALEKMKEFATDCKQLKQVENYIVPMKETEEYFIFQMGERMQKDKRIQDTFVKTLSKRDSIRLDRDVFFSPSGIGVVHKAKPTESLTDLFNK